MSRRFLLALVSGLGCLFSLLGQEISPTLTEAQRDSLNALRQALVRQHAQRLPDSIPPLYRLLRHEPPRPFGGDRGYQFLHAMIPKLSPADYAPDLPWRQKGTMAKLVDLVGGYNLRWGKWSLGGDGLVDIIPDYNSNDGLWLGYEFQLRRSLAPGRSIQLRTANNYTLRSHQWYTENHLLLYFAPQIDGLLMLSGGRTSRETTRLTPEEQFKGYYASLPGANSPIRDYIKYFAQVRTRLAFGNAFGLSASLLWEDRRPQLGLPLQHHRTLQLSSQLLWAPSFLNATESGLPLPVGYRRELGVSYKGAFSPSASEELRTGIPYSRYHQIEGFARGAIALGEEDRLHIKVTAGGFLSHRYRSESDQKYFARLHNIGRTPFWDSWATLPRYFQGGEGWTTQEVYLNSTHLLLGGRRFLDEVMRLDDAIHLRNVVTFDGRAFSELGYSVGWGDLMRLGLFGGMDWNNRHLHLAVRLSIPVIFLTSSWSERN